VSIAEPSQMHGTDYSPSGHRLALLRFPDHELNQSAIYRQYVRQDSLSIYFFLKVRFDKSLHQV
jgi:hypothetical protein